MRLLQIFPVWDRQLGESLMGRGEFPLIFEVAKLIHMLTPYTFLPGWYAHEVSLSLDKRFGQGYGMIPASALLEVEVHNIFQHRSQLG